MTDDEPGTRASFLDRLSADARLRLFEVGTRRRFPAGSTVFFEGDDAHEAVVILDGLVKVLVVSPHGRELILDVLGPSSLLGELASLDGGKRSATAQALTELEVLSVGSEAFIRCLLQHPTDLLNLTVLIAGRLRASDRRQLEFGTGDALARLCARLQDVAARFGEEGEDCLVTIESPLSQAELASWSGLSREAVVKSLRTLRELGWIANRGNRITILQPDALRDRAQLERVER